MRFTRTKVGAAVAVSAAAVVLPIFAQPAFADYAPSAGDVVGVGSDTVQYAVDFAADGDFLADAGYNTGGFQNKLVNFDATPDANARLAYGSYGTGVTETLAGSTTAVTACAPGTGGTAGTGSQTADHADTPCVLNPTIVLRAGENPVQRPNGSGGGANAAVADDAQAVSSGTYNINYVRASSAQGATLNPQGANTAVKWDAIVIGTDTIGTLVSNGSNAPAAGLSQAELAGIYTCQYTTWNSLPGNSTGSADTIIPIVPQVGSGTRSTWLKYIGGGTAVTPGSCVKTAEENDPFAIQAQSNPKDAIEPMSNGRLNMFLGDKGVKNSSQVIGTSNGVGGYFYDPSCPAYKVAASSTNSSNTQTNTACPARLTPAVTYLNGGVNTGNATDGKAVADATLRNLYIYFKDQDITSTTPFQPGGSLNFVNTLFYNPGTGGAPFGPGGAPFFDTNAGFNDVAAAGINPTYQFLPAGQN